MKPVITLLTAGLMLVLAACANGPSRAELAAQETARQAAEERAQAEAAEAAARRAADEAEFERLEREIAQQRARQQAEREAEERRLEARRLEERRLAAEAEARAREAEAEARRRAQAAETGRQRQQPASTAADSSREREQAVTLQQARIAELRAQIAANQAQTTSVENANDALREAISAAEELTEVLASEQEKYTNANQATGQTAGALSKADIDALSAEVERLRALATELAAQQENP